jgi:hypothetical protein
MVKQLLGAALSLVRVVVIADAIEFAMELAFIPTPAMAHTVTVLDTGGGGPSNGVDYRPCIFFQVDNQSAWYAIPDASPHATQTFLLAHDSFTTGGGIPFDFQIGNPIPDCSYIPEAVPGYLGTWH